LRKISYLSGIHKEPFLKIYQIGLGEGAFGGLPSGEVGNGHLRCCASLK